MLLEKHPKNIVDTDSWFLACPPKKGEKQWVSGRSAMELAKYITSSLPAVPVQIEQALKGLVPDDARFRWDAEYVTPLPGKGEGRNHDGILFHEDLLVTIEAKTDETLENLLSEELEKASVNKLHRISTLLAYLFKGRFCKYQDLRYQLITAAAGTLLEAQKRSVSSALMLVLVFRTPLTDKEKLAANHADIQAFLTAAEAYPEKDLLVIPNNTDIKLYFKEILI